MRLGIFFNSALNSSLKPIACVEQWRRHHEVAISYLWCDPRVRTVRFNLLSGAPVVQHSMDGLTENLRAAAVTPGAQGSRVSGNRAAIECGRQQPGPAT
jgi:hypothetical protein